MTAGGVTGWEARTGRKAMTGRSTHSMRTLILSDIHSNFQALTAVWDDAIRDGAPVDALWCLGDVLGYGPDPSACIAFLRERDAQVIAGNHDLAAIGRIPLDDFNAYAAAACRFQAALLTAEERGWVEALPLRLSFGDITLAHGSPREPVWEYLDHAAVATASFPHFETRGCLVGHTHLPLLFVQQPRGTVQGFRLQPETAFTPEPGQRFIYNPGSVGQPRDGDPRAASVIYDTETGALTHHRTQYDIPETQRRMSALGLPEPLSARLSVGR